MDTGDTPTPSLCRTLYLQQTQKVVEGSLAVWARRVGKAHCASGMFQIGARFVVLQGCHQQTLWQAGKWLAPEPTQCVLMPDPRGACLNRLLAKASPCLPLSAQALQLTLRYRHQGDWYSASSMVFLRACVDKNQQPTE